VGFERVVKSSMSVSKEFFLNANYISTTNLRKY